MIGPPAGVRVYLACGATDMRKGMIGLAMLVQQVLADDPFGGALFAFRGRNAGLIKVLWQTGSACACSPSASSAASSFGRRQRRPAPSRFRRHSWRRC